VANVEIYTKDFATVFLFLNQNFKFNLCAEINLPSNVQECGSFGCHDIGTISYRTLDDIL